MADTDSQLARRLARGEEAAFAELYDACSGGLLRYLAVRLASADRAADVLQAAMLRAVKSRRRFAKVDSPAAYLFQIACRESCGRRVGIVASVAWRRYCLLWESE